MNIAICFLTTSKEPCKFNLSRLNVAAAMSKKHNIDIYLYKDTDLEYSNTNNTIYFSYQYLKNKFNYNHDFQNPNSGTKNKSGLQLLPFLDMYINNKDSYDMYLFWEDDACLIDLNIFDEIDFENCKVIFQEKRLLSNCDWFWQKETLYSLNNKDMPIYMGLLNIWGATSETIEELIKFINDGNYGHHELIVDSFIMNNYPNDINYIDNYIKVKFLLFPYEIDKLSKNEIKNSQYSIIHPIKDVKSYIKYNKIKLLP